MNAAEAEQRLRLEEAASALPDLSRESAITTGKALLEGVHCSEEQRDALAEHVVRLYSPSKFQVRDEKRFDFFDGSLPGDFTVFSKDQKDIAIANSMYVSGDADYPNPLCVLKLVQNVDADYVDLEAVVAHIIKSWESLYRARWDLLLKNPMKFNVGFERGRYNWIRDRFFSRQPRPSPFGENANYVTYHAVNSNRRRVKELWGEA